MEDDNDNEYEREPEEDKGSILCKGIALLLLSIIAITIFVVLGNFFADGYYFENWIFDLLLFGNPYSIFIFVLGFFVGWIMREATRK